MLSVRSSIVLLAIYFSQLTGCGEPARYDPNDPLTGIWAGKWDGKWTVLFVVKRSGDRYKILYRWEEDQGYPFSEQRIRGRATARGLTTGGIIIELDDADNTRATAKGKFETPRTAQLVRLKEVDESTLTIGYVKQQLTQVSEG